MRSSSTFWPLHWTRQKHLTQAGPTSLFHLKPARIKTKRVQSWTGCIFVCRATWFRKKLPGTVFFIAKWEIKSSSTIKRIKWSAPYREMWLRDTQRECLDYHQSHGLWFIIVQGPRSTLVEGFQKLRCPDNKFPKLPTMFSICNQKNAEYKSQY